MRMLKRLTLLLAGLGLTALGLIGLVVPVLPGFLFLLLAAACFAALAPGAHRRFAAHPRLARFFRRLEQGRELTLFNRARLAFWAGLEALGPTRVR